jgi:cold shock protein
VWNNSKAVIIRNSFNSAQLCNLDDQVERLKGKVVWFSNTKGYGFIGRDHCPDTFVHFSAIVKEGYKSLEVNDEVEFEIVQGEKGLQAANVVILNAVGLVKCA